MHRTTVMLEEALYRAVKRQAIDRGRPVRQLIEEALRRYLGLRTVSSRRRTPGFGVYEARVRQSMTRSRMYRDLDTRVT